MSKKKISRLPTKNPAPRWVVNGQTMSLAQAMQWVVQAWSSQQTVAMMQAEQLCADIVASHPEQAMAWHILGLAAQQRQQHAEAMNYLQQAAQANPQDAAVWNSMGVTAKALGDWQAAEFAWQHALSLNPRQVMAWNNLGTARKQRRDFAGAVEAYQHALALQPDFVLAWNNLGNVLADLGEYAAAQEAYQRTLALAPQLHDARFNLGILQLRLGDWQAGWEGYEWRWQSAGRQPRVFEQPCWDGSALAGKTILVYAEQGLGDSIQFARYLPLLAGQGARVIFECQPAVLRLVQTLHPDIECVASGTPLPPFEVYCPLLSLPHRFATRPDTIPLTIPYLHVTEELRRSWYEYRQQLMPAQPAPRKRVGVLWGGNPLLVNNLSRSMTLEDVMPLLAHTQIEWTILQKEQRPDDFATQASANGWQDEMPYVRDLADTAVLIDTLDLVISVDTSVVHVAAALGKPTWVMVAKNNCWRWLQEREDSPWYPQQVRLFRQRELGDWAELVARVSAALGEWCTSTAGATDE